MKKIDEFNAEDRIAVKLLENSVHFLSGEIDKDNIDDCIKWITFENLDSREHILTLYINSTGGDLYSAFALIDVMKSSKHPIRTIGIGSVMSAAFLIFSAGTHGERYAGRNASFMCHQYSQEVEGKHHDLKASMKEGENCNDRMLAILKEATGLAISKIKSKLLSASDVYLTAGETVEFGVADHLL